MGGGAIIKAARQVREKMVAIAAGLLDAPADQITVSDGFFRLGEAAIPFAQIAAAAYLHTFLLPPGMDPGLSVIVGYDSFSTSPFPDERGKLNVSPTYATAAAAASRTSTTSSRTGPSTGSTWPGSSKERSRSLSTRWWTATRCPAGLTAG